MRVTQVDRALIRIALALVLGLAAHALAGVSHAAEKPLARYVAKADLVVYSEFLGLETHRDAWKRTSTYQLLNETTTSAMLRDLATQAIDSIITSVSNKPASGALTGAHVVAAVERLADKGFVLAVHSKSATTSPSMILVARGAGKGTDGHVASALLELISTSRPREKTTREDGRKITFVKAPSPNLSTWAWWVEEDDFIFTSPGTEAQVESVIATIEGKSPSAVDLPAIAELARKDDNFEPVFLSFSEVANLSATPPGLKDGIKRVDSRWGFIGPQVMSVTRIQAPAPRKGLLALMDQPTFILNDSLPVPPNSNDFVLISVDPGKLFDQVLAIVKERNPKNALAVPPMLAAANGALGVNLREELLGQIGPKMVFTVEPEMRPVSLTPYQSVVDWGAHPPKVTAVLEIRDTAKFARTLESIVAVINRRLKAEAPEAPEGSEVQLRPLKAPERGYVLDVPLGTFPLPNGFRPTMMLGERSLVIAISPREARKALKYADHPQPINKLLEKKPAKLLVYGVSDPRSYMPDVIANAPFLVQAYSMMGMTGPSGSGAISSLRLKLDADRFPAAEELVKFMSPGTVEVSVDDAGLTVTTRESFPTPNLVTAAPFAVGLLAPAVSAAREAAQRSQAMNNLKQQMLAMFNYESSMGTYPPVSIKDADDKPLLSWRVAILPFLDEEELYKEFHLDEPWDSPHNKTLLARMPAVYKSTHNQPADPNSTFYQVFTDKGALFDTKGKGTKIVDVADGTSSTIAIVEAAKAVPWTKPEDLPFDPEKDLPKFGGLGFSSGFHVALADGSVRFIQTTIDPKILKALITRAGGEVLADDSY